MLTIAPGHIDFFDMKVCCVFSIEHRGDSDKYTVTLYHCQYQKENHPKLCEIMFEAMHFFVSDSRTSSKQQW